MAKTTTTTKSVAASNGKSSASSNVKMAPTNGTSPKSLTKTPAPQIKKEEAKQSKANDSRLEEFFHDELKDIYWAEKHLVKTLPKMQKAASSPDLKNAFVDMICNEFECYYFRTLAFWSGNEMDFYYPHFPVALKKLMS